MFQLNCIIYFFRNQKLWPLSYRQHLIRLKKKKKKYVCKLHTYTQIYKLTMNNKYNILFKTRKYLQI
jgi:hypothetical protein